jgi:glycerol-1-phosphate dehydrogenase [NAD(P)+]
MVPSGLDRSLRRTVSAARGDRDAVTALFEALGITGFALQYMKNSRCVSGCEHMFSHVWEMENLCVNGVPVTHGHKVALGTLAAAACTECLFAEKPAPRPRPSWAEREAQARAAFAGLGRAGDAAVNTVRSKFMEGEAASALEQAALDSWDALRTAVFEKLPPYADIRAMLGEAGCPVRPEQIGLTKTRVIAAAVKAQMIRCRFTALDLAYETGAFSDVLKRVEASNKYLC